MNIEEQLRKAAIDTGQSMKRLADGSGIGYQSMHAFIQGYRTLRLPVAARLATYLNLELRPRKKRRKD